MEGEGASVEVLDEQLDEALGEFDAAVMGEGSSAGEDMTDILDPLSSGSAGTESDAPIFEEADLGEAGEAVENQSIAQRAAEGGSGGGGGSGSGGGGSGGGGGAEMTGDQAGAAGGGGGQDGDDAGDIIPIPEDVGDGRNDDIVQRQIRDAAMKEHDPALREKLWDEYRRIKGQ